jgi:serine/threonine protein kinase
MVFKNVLDDNTIQYYARKICGISSARNDGEIPQLYKKIFVTLVLCEKTSTILKFLAEIVTDDDLPLTKVRRPKKSSGIFDLGRRSKPKVPLTNSMEQLYGRHGDIKPANVLLFNDPNEHDNIGTLKLTDFGLAEFSALHSRSYKPKSKVATSPSYRPPECDLHNGVIGRSYDIWTLGCLYLEFITWLLGGWELIEEFTEKRAAFDPMWHDIPTDTFFEIVKCSATGTPGAMIKPAVTNVRHTPPN